MKLIHRQVRLMNSCLGLDENNFDQMTPINAPEKVVAMAWLLDCGRACMDDPKCQGYAILRNVEPIGSSPCSIYYVISGFINDPQRVSFVIRNATAVRMWTGHNIFLRQIAFLSILDLCTIIVTCSPSKCFLWTDNRWQIGVVSWLYYVYGEIFGTATC